MNLQNHQQAPYDRIYRDLIEGYYFQDDWKLSPRFTLNLGVRYDTMVNFFSIYSPILSRFNLGTGSTWNAKIASGTASLANTHKVLDHNIGGFTPRVGFSWDVFGTGKTAIARWLWHVRGPAPVSAHHGLDLWEPAQLLQSGRRRHRGRSYSKALSLHPNRAWDMSCPVLDTSNATLNSSGGLVINGVISRAGMGGYDPNFKMQQVEAWSLSIQHQLQEQPDCRIELLRHRSASPAGLPKRRQPLRRRSDPEQQPAEAA